ncbi:hypothetical protein X801_04611 [Opisthorchis viverrini]|uniref:Peptidase S1 domain-containing protein n=1 Tax=Opisthorchis viverrini TaxID=6198 RepID=A0A1S8WYJ1_OPIVI|nr:hypothetical protein X801_04611 [Opisthorchis viverrini]
MPTHGVNVGYWACVVGTGQIKIALFLFTFHSNAVPPNIQVSRSLTCYPHENYIIYKPTVDIALLKLSIPLDLTRPNISIVNLPTGQNTALPQLNETGAVAGFGNFLHPDFEPTTAQLATFKVVAHQICAQRHRVYNPTYNFCIDDDVTKRAMLQANADV